MKRVILLRSNPVNPDPPVEKAALALLNDGYHVRIIGWDRDADYGLKENLLQLSGYEVEVIRFGIKAQFISVAGLYSLHACARSLDRAVLALKIIDLLHRFGGNGGLEGRDDLFNRNVIKSNVKICRSALAYNKLLHLSLEAVLVKNVGCTDKLAVNVDQDSVLSVIISKAHRGVFTYGDLHLIYHSSEILVLGNESQVITARSLWSFKNKAEDILSGLIC